MFAVLQLDEGIKLTAYAASCRSGAARVGVDSEAFRYGGAKAKSNDRIRSACATGLARNA